MAAINKMKTVPGFTLQSKNFMVRFISGLQNNQVSKSVDQETDWTQVIVIIFKNLEKFSLSVDKFCHFLTKELNSWFKSLEGAQHLDLKVSVKIEEKVFFIAPYGSKKKLTILFSDNLKTQIIFHIKKKSNIKSLKELGAEVVMDSLKNDETIIKLGIPRTLTRDLLLASMNDWSPKYYRSHVCKCCKKRERGETENIENMPKRGKFCKC